jgi:hypothetical protein
MGHTQEHCWRKVDGSRDEGVEQSHTAGWGEVNPGRATVQHRHTWPHREREGACLLEFCGYVLWTMAGATGNVANPKCWE